MKEILTATKPKNYLWLDLLKGIAMIAVVIDHLYAYYQNLTIQYHTGFHVSLFILLAGFTSAISIQNRGGVVNFSYILKRISKIFIPYLVATFIYCFSQKIFNPLIIFQKIITFKASGQLYFVLFYIQLIAISYFIYKLINHQKSNFFDIPLIIFFYLFASVLNENKLFPSFYGGSAVLFGGSFFFLYTLGFFFKKYENIFENKKLNLFLLILSLTSFVLFEMFGLISKSWSNPANNWLIIYCLIILFLVFSLYKLFLFRLPKILTPITIVGQQSLYVFLYHTLVISIFSKLFPLSNYPLLTTSYLLLASLYLPILFFYLYNYLRPKNTH